MQRDEPSCSSALHLPADVWFFLPPRVISVKTLKPHACCFFIHTRVQISVCREMFVAIGDQLKSQTDLRSCKVRKQWRGSYRMRSLFSRWARRSSTRCLTRNTPTSSLPVTLPKQKQVICVPAVMRKPQCFGGSRPLNARHAASARITCVAAYQLQESRKTSSFKAKMTPHT